MPKFKKGDWVLTESGCIVQVLLNYKSDIFVAIRVDAKDVMRPMCRHTIVKVVPSPKELLKIYDYVKKTNKHRCLRCMLPDDAKKEITKLEVIHGKLQKPSTKTKNRPYTKDKS